MNYILDILFTCYTQVLPIAFAFFIFIWSILLIPYCLYGLIYSSYKKYRSYSQRSKEKEYKKKCEEIYRMYLDKRIGLEEYIHKLKKIENSIDCTCNFCNK